MALTESTEYDSIDVVGEFKHIQVKKSLVIKKDGVKIAKESERYSLQCGWTEDDGTWKDTDISSEPTDVKNIANAVWTQTIKDNFKAFCIEQYKLKTTPA